MSNNSELNTKNKRLLNAGFFRTSWFDGELNRSDVIQLPDGWTVVKCHETAASEAIYRIADAIDVVIPYEDLVKAVIKHIIHTEPSLKEMYTSFPTQEALDLLAEYLGMEITYKGYNPNTMEEVIDMTDEEEKLQSLLLATIDGNCPASRLVRMYGKSGKRTWFNCQFLPSIPFVLHELGKPVRLLGHKTHPKLHKTEEKGRFVGIEMSDCGNRSLLEYIVSEQSVEGNSFNVPVNAKETVAGEYTEVNSGIEMSFSLHRKDARKFSGMGTVIRSIYPDYVAGQTAWVVLDRDMGLAHLEIHETKDYEARERMKVILNTGIVPAEPMKMSA